MELSQLILLIVALTLTVFTFGALIAWRLEGRQPLVAPVWLIVLRNVSWLALVAFIVIANEPPTGIVVIDPLWWNLFEVVLVILSVAGFVLELRAVLRRRQAT